MPSMHTTTSLESHMPNERTPSKTPAAPRAGSEASARRPAAKEVRQPSPKGKASPQARHDLRVEADAAVTAPGG